MIKIKIILFFFYLYSDKSFVVFALRWLLIIVTPLGPVNNMLQ